MKVIENAAFYLKSPAFVILCLMSAYSIALMAYQAVLQFTNRENLSELIGILDDDKKGIKDIGAYAGMRKTPHRRLLLAGVKHAGKPEETLGVLLNEEARALRWEAEHRLSALGTIANTAPFIGLFGTVVGVIHAFHAISKAQGAGPSVVAAGISEALVTTAAGLFVAIPAVFAYNYFLKYARRLSLELDRVAVLLILRLRDL